MEGRVPPHSAEAEKSVLGAAMLSKDALFDVMEVVKPADFYDENHKEIFAGHDRPEPQECTCGCADSRRRIKKRETALKWWAAEHISHLCPP